MNSYKIQLTGVKDGSNSNSFEIKDKFFETFAQSEISKADIIADTILHKDGNQLSLNIEITGVIKNISCDICDEEISVPLSSSLTLIIKEEEHNENIADDVIYIASQENEVCIKNYLFEMIVLAVPKKRRHKLNSIEKGECNKEMVNLINKYTDKTEKSSDPRWEALKDIKLK